MGANSRVYLGIVANIGLASVRTMQESPPGEWRGNRVPASIMLRKRFGEHGMRRARSDQCYATGLGSGWRASPSAPDALNRP